MDRDAKAAETEQKANVEYVVFHSGVSDWMNGLGGSGRLALS